MPESCELVEITLGRTPFKGGGEWSSSLSGDGGYERFFMEGWLIEKPASDPSTLPCVPLTLLLL